MCLQHVLKFISLQEQQSLQRQGLMKANSNTFNCISLCTILLWKLLRVKCPYDLSENKTPQDAYV